MYGLSRAIQKNIITAKYRRIPLDIRVDDAASAAWAGAVAGVKAQLSFNGQAEVPSTADIVRVAGGVHYIELTQGEANTELGLVTARVPAVAGRREAVGFAEIVDYAPFDAGATVEQVADAVWDELRAGHIAAGSFGEGVLVAALADGIITAAKIATNAIDADSIAADAPVEIANAILGTSLGVAYANHTVGDVLKLMLATLASKASGLNTTTATFRNPADSGDVLVATVDEFGNRTVVTRTP